MLMGHGERSHLLGFGERERCPWGPLPKPQLR